MAARLAFIKKRYSFEEEPVELNFDLSDFNEGYPYEASVKFNLSCDYEITDDDIMGHESVTWDIKVADGYIYLSHKDSDEEFEATEDENLDVKNIFSRLCRFVENELPFIEKEDVDLAEVDEIELVERFFEEEIINFIDDNLTKNKRR